MAVVPIRCRPAAPAIALEATSLTFDIAAATNRTSGQVDSSCLMGSQMQPHGLGHDADVVEGIGS